MPEKFDIISYILGLKNGKKSVEIDGTNLTFTDDGEGNITITEDSDNG